MTRKHFQAVADILKGIALDNPEACAIHDNLVREFSEYFKGENPRFDVSRFKAACFKEVK